MGYLSDVARRRIAAVILVLGAAVAALAFADVGPFSNPPTEQERVQATVERFFEAARSKDFKAVCGQLTQQEQRTVEQRAGPIASQRGLKGCDQIIGALLGAQLSQTRIAKVNDVRVSGNRAVVDSDLRIAGAKHPQPTTVDLFLIGRQWKIADFGE
jgi:ketosteroid isomerase-like protein